jgi:hypothetical protein
VFRRFPRGLVILWEVCDCGRDPLAFRPRRERRRVRIWRRVTPKLGEYWACGACDQNDAEIADGNAFHNFTFAGVAEEFASLRRAFWRKARSVPSGPWCHPTAQVVEADVACCARSRILPYWNACARGERLIWSYLLVDDGMVVRPEDMFCCVRTSSGCSERHVHRRGIADCRDGGWCGCKSLRERAASRKLTGKARFRDVHFGLRGMPSFILGDVHCSEHAPLA